MRGGDMWFLQLATVFDNDSRHASGSSESMSDSWLRIIPTEPTFVPSSSAAQEARTLLDQFALVSDSGSPSKAVNRGQVVFIDAGSNFNRIECPWCARELELDWWHDRMESAASTSFQELLVRTPCCDVTTSLNDLRYDWPQGFARWWLELMNPIGGALSDQQLELIAAALDHPVRTINTRY